MSPATARAIPTRPGRAAASAPLARKNPRTRILLVGRGADRERVAEVLQRQLILSIVKRETIDEAVAAIDDLTLAIVLVGPPAHTDVRSVRATVEPGKTPCFVVVPEDVSDRSARRLYRAGASAVFEWPAEALILPEVVARALGTGLRPPKGPGAPEDRRLTAAIRARLQIASDPADRVRVSVREGVARLSGSVDRLRRKQEIEEFVSELPGVRHVETTRIEVDRGGVSDADLRRDVRAVLKRMTPEGHEPPMVAVVEGVVTLSGGVARRAVSERIVEVLASLPGVTKIVDCLVVDSRIRPSRAPFRRLKALVESAFPGEAIRVTTFGDVAIVSGHVRLLRTKMAIEALLREAAGGIGEVVNKIEVRD